ncbi:alpha/beta fold hydrolase [Aureimonas jatrophae]|uniref:Pimeloyl-ACP methyl ester carboxylesterase n=1 Tax=Aureimonas jatrophae TaxID=1166073 RepID=A0A1H0IJQ6_9HYPH|nr:alpha/beta hydrolase [Aureimonas jatrophae]MBB3952213.1 pimeloyl-ACP methyl ester carboxylesterase [Aureimonas jatrophae]SDO31628.1 Pimeloyl-ACP methyl ester carboxylesterase [Aureimonas jatrophae]
MLLLLVPAFACDGDLFESLVPLLRPDFECESVIGEEPDLKACAAQVLAHSKGRPFVVGGTSFGGHVAREVALTRPANLRGLVIMGAGARAPADRTVFDERRARLEAGAAAAMNEDMARRIVFEEEGRGQEAADTFRRMAVCAPIERLLAQNEALATRPDRLADLASIDVPALLIWGAEDQFSAPAEGQAMAERMHDARFVELEACGHLPSLETPMRVASEIRSRFA